jgi:WD40 repeat protein
LVSVKRVLGVLVLLGALALAQDGKPVPSQVWSDPDLWPPTTVEVQGIVEPIEISSDNKTFLAVGEGDIFELTTYFFVPLRSAFLPGRVLAVSHDGNRAAATYSQGGSTCLLGTAHVWSRSDFRAPRDNDEWRATDLLEAPRGAIYVSGGELLVTYGDKGVDLYKADTGELLRWINWARDVNSVCEVGSGQVLVASQRRTLLWDLATGKDLPVSPSLAPGGATAVAAIPSSRRVAVLRQGGLAIHDLETGGVKDAVAANLHKPLVVAAGGGRILAADCEGTLHVFDGELAELGHLRGAREWPDRVAISADGGFVVASDGRRLLRWTLPATREPFEVRAHTGAVRAISVSPDGERVLTGSDDGTVRLWEAATGKHLRCLRGHSASIDLVALSPDGKKAGSLDVTGRLVRWDLASGTEEATIESLGSRGALGFRDTGELVLLDESGLRASCSLPGGRFLVASRKGLEVVDAQGKQEKLLAPATPRETGPEFSPTDAHLVATPDGKRAFVAFEGRLELWDLAAGKRLRRFENTGEDPRPVAISPDGKLGVTEDGALWLLDGGWVTERGFAGSAIAFLGSGSILVGEASGRLVRYDR